METIIKYSLGHLDISQEKADYGKVCAILPLAAERQFSCAREMIEKDVAAATAFLLDSIAKREEIVRVAHVSKASADESSSFIFNLNTQLLYLLLCERGDVRRPTASDDLDRCALYRLLWPILGDIVLLTRVHNSAMTGLSLGSIDGGKLIEKKTEADRLRTETQVNSQRTERLFRGRHAPLHEPEVNAAQRTVLGLSLDDCTNMMRNNFWLLWKRTTVVEKDGVMLAALDGASEPVRNLLEAFTLTLDRVRLFTAPFYFGLGVPREDPPPSGLPSDTSIKTGRLTIHATVRLPPTIHAWRCF